MLNQPLHIKPRTSCFIEPKFHLLIGPSDARIGWGAAPIRHVHSVYPVCRVRVNISYHWLAGFVGQVRVFIHTEYSHKCCWCFALTHTGYRIGSLFYKCVSLCVLTRCWRPVRDIDATNFLGLHDRELQIDSTKHKSYPLFTFCCLIFPPYYCICLGTWK